MTTTIREVMRKCDRFRLIQARQAPHHGFLAVAESCVDALESILFVRRIASILMTVDMAHLARFTIMPALFPGMDPYLEGSLWTTYQLHSWPRISCKPPGYAPHE
jgi:hypothetical protein